MNKLKKYLFPLFAVLVVIGGLGVWSCKKNARALTLKNIFGWWLLAIRYNDVNSMGSSGIADVVDSNGLSVNNTESSPLVKVPSASAPISSAVIDAK